MVEILVGLNERSNTTLYTHRGSHKIGVVRVEHNFLAKYSIVLPLLGLKVIQTNNLKRENYLAFQQLTTHRH